MNAISKFSNNELSPEREGLLEAYGVAAVGFNAAAACRARIDYLKAFLIRTKLQGFVLGISGGIDSTTAGRLAQLACMELRSEGYPALFWAIRLPAGVQRDEEEAQTALAFIQPDRTLTINIGPASDALAQACSAAYIEDEAFPAALDATNLDYHKGNIKARARMAAQYHAAGMFHAAVLGTDHNAEAVMGFFTKFGDGAADLTVLDGLNKRQVRACASFLGAPDGLVNKVPTADLEELNPGKTDESAFGFTYAELDDYLEGKDIPSESERRILAGYLTTQHKRQPIVSFTASQENRRS